MTHAEILFREALCKLELADGLLRPGRVTAELHTAMYHLAAAIDEVERAGKKEEYEDSGLRPGDLHAAR